MPLIVTLDGMKLPGGNRAVVDRTKLTDYCLNEHHPRGKHKARVFVSVLGITAESINVLRTALLRAAVAEDAVPVGSDRFGERYVIDFSDRRPAWTRARKKLMNTKPHRLDVVALLTDLPELGLVRGQVGTVVEILDGAYEVEFSDDSGKTYAELALDADQLLVLRHRRQHAA